MRYPKDMEAYEAIMQGFEMALEQAKAKNKEDVDELQKAMIVHDEAQPKLVESIKMYDRDIRRLQDERKSLERQLEAARQTERHAMERSEKTANESRRAYKGIESKIETLTKFKPWLIIHIFQEEHPELVLAGFTMGKKVYRHYMDWPEDSFIPVAGNMVYTTYQRHSDTHSKQSRDIKDVEMTYKGLKVRTWGGGTYGRDYELERFDWDIIKSTTFAPGIIPDDGRHSRVGNCEKCGKTIYRRWRCPFKTVRKGAYYGTHYDSHDSYLGYHPCENCGHVTDPVKPGTVGECEVCKVKLWIPKDEDRVVIPLHEPEPAKE